MGRIQLFFHHPAMSYCFEVNARVGQYQLFTTAKIGPQNIFKKVYSSTVERNLYN